MYKGIFYHASSSFDIKSFELGVIGYGEHNTPIKAVWICTEKNGASYHIKVVLKNNGRLRDGSGCIYECRLDDDIVFVDANNPELPLCIFRKLKAKFPLYKRLFMKREHWYKYLWMLSEKIGTGHISDRLKICKEIGVEALANPRRGEEGQSFDEGVYGTTVAVLDTLKINIIRKYRHSVNDKCFQESLENQFAL